MDALTFGRRSDLIKIARKRIAENPGKYVDYIYGEWDAGGTAWMVLAPKPTPSAVKAAGTAMPAIPSRNWVWTPTWATVPWVN